jgi:hypothetical protein
VGQQFVREQGTSSIPAYRRRVRRLALIYTGIVCVCLATIVLIVVKGKLFITLSQRSNVETLTLAFIIVLFGYLAIVSLPGFWGALTILALNAPAWLGRDQQAVEQRKQAALKPHSGDPAAAYLNCRVEQLGQRGEPVRIPLRDAAGSLGRIVVDGVRMTHEEALQAGSNSLFGYFEQRIQQLVRQRDPRARVESVQWATIDDEQALQYESLATFGARLEQQLKLDPLWPTVELTEEDLSTLVSEGRELCPILRNEAHLPDLEYSAEHRLPIIPEPLGIISLSRQESRADPVASMGCALLVALLICAIVLAIIFFPPWTPPK